MDNRIETLVAREYVRISELFLEQLGDICLVDNTLTDQMVEDLLVEFTLGNNDITVDSGMFSKLADHASFENEDDFYDALIERIQTQLEEWVMNMNLPSIWSAFMKKAYIECVGVWALENQEYAYPQPVVDAVESALDNYTEDIHEQVPVEGRVFFNRYNDITSDLPDHLPYPNFQEALELLDMWRNEIEENLDPVSAHVTDISSAEDALVELVSSALVTIAHSAARDATEFIITESEEWIPRFMNELKDRMYESFRSATFVI